MGATFWGHQQYYYYYYLSIMQNFLTDERNLENGVEFASATTCASDLGFS
jgi:hypothetical protein